MSVLLSSDPIIGVIGGMGPSATIELMRRIVERTPAKDDADHIRILVDNNPRIPSRIAYLLEGGPIDPAPALARTAAGLQAAGATHLVMPCNTAHHFAPQIESAVTIPFIDMIDVSLQACIRRFGPGARIGIVGSPALRAVGVVDRACQDQGLEAVYPDANGQAIALSCIREVKAGRIGTDVQNAYLSLKRETLSMRVDGLLVCCSEFSVLEMHAQPDPEKPIDTLDELTTAVLEVCDLFQSG